MFITIVCLLLLISVYLYLEHLGSDRALKNIPRVPFLPVLLDTLKGVPFDVTYTNHIEPVIQRKGYARVWRFGRWVLMVQDSDAVKEIHRNTSVFLKIEKINEYGLRYVAFGNSNIVLSNGDEWKRHRKIANPAFHKNWQTCTFGDCTNDTIDQILKDPLDVDIHSLLERTTIDVLGKSVFNYEFKAVLGKSNETFDIYNKMMKGLRQPVYSLFPFLDRIYHSSTRTEGYDAATKFRNIMKGLIEEKRRSLVGAEHLPQDQNDLLTSMILSGEKQSDEDLINNTLIFFLAGHDTTANTLLSTIYYLCQNEDIQTKARQEVINVTKEDKPCVPTLEQVNSMDYLMLIIKESMRIMTTVPYVERCASKDYKFKDGTTITKGCIVAIDSYGVHHDKKLSDPYTFNPDRYLDDKLNKDWMPFGYGSRICMGMNFSIIEQKVILSMLLMKFDFKFSSNKGHSSKNIRLNTSGLLRPTGLYVDFTQRHH